jgi:hypothetical protein
MMEEGSFPIFVLPGDFLLRVVEVYRVVEVFCFFTFSPVYSIDHPGLGQFFSWYGAPP